MFGYLNRAAQSIAGVFERGRHSHNEGHQRGSNSPADNSPPTASLSSANLKLIVDIRQKARRLITEWGSLQELKTLLQTSPQVINEIVNSRDLSGYNLLQYAIIANLPDTTRYLVTQGAELNAPICGRPLHLANKLGHAKVAEILLEYGADPDVLSSICFPDHHIQPKTVYSDGKGWQAAGTDGLWACSCCGDVYDKDQQNPVRFEYPLYYAMQSDSVECVKLLLYKFANKLLCKKPKLHLVCQIGAVECFQYFIQGEFKSLHANDDEGLQPLQHAVKWGRKFIELLVLNGASVIVKTKNGQTLLHLLYENGIYISSLAETTAYLLDCGLSMNINVVDNSGNSALNVLLNRLHADPPCSKLNLKCDKEHDKNTGSQSSPAVLDETGTAVGEMTLTDDLDRPLCQESQTSKESNACQIHSACAKNDFVFPKCKHAGMPDMTVTLSAEEMEVVRCVDMLLQSGLNPNVANKLGSTSLHVLMHINSLLNVKLVTTNSHHHCSFRVIYCILKLLLSEGANAMLKNNLNNTVLDLFINSYCYVLYTCYLNQSTPTLPTDEEIDFVTKCIHLVGNQAPPADNVCLVHLIVGQIAFLERLPTLGIMTFTEQQEFVSIFSRYVYTVTAALLKYHRRGTVCKYDLHATYYKLISFANLFPDYFIHDFLVLLLQYGANPNIGGKHIPMSVYRFRSRPRDWPVFPLLHLCNTIGEGSLKDKEDELLSVFDVLYHTMEDNQSRQCMFHYVEYDCHHLNRGRNTVFKNNIQKMMVNPRKLKQTVAQQIYVETCGRLKENVDNLPLPLSLRKYLCQFHY